VDFELSEEHKMIRDMVRRFAEKECAPRIPELDERGEFDREIIEKMAGLGILGIPFPEKYDGGGADYVSLALACEELERVDTSLRVVLSVHIGLCGLGILQWGTEEQRRKYLPRLARGDMVGAFGLTEPNAGTDAAAIETTARRDGDVYVLNGEKTWISLANAADLFLVFARTSRQPGARSMSAFIVQRDVPGFESAPIHGKLGVRAGDTGSFTLADVRVPVEDRLGEEGEGFKIAMSCIDNGRFTVAAGSVGLIRACLEATTEYARQRHTFGKPLGEHQLIQRMIAEMVAGLEASRLLVLRAAWLRNEGRRATRETSLAKWFACDRAFAAAADAVQIHGAYGYSNEYPVERYLRNAKGAQIYEGTREVHQLLQAQYALGVRKDKPLRCTLPGWPYDDGE